ncbi:sulfotransferase family 2 domain-containing protein [Phenylobacterium sp.]|uniref:sulfotransferase family 2 domain-containing protein n=1 Tax=Phenylobacterium sp. TaxID=1871053 RepID=UPI00289803B4|nr:sulfotransferase family 2 domain-containing protein [Phenylobacterium sp.]
MIVSHRHRFIFAAVPKTGTHSVRQALREQLGDGDVEQVGLFVDKRFPWEELAAIRHGHLALRQVRPYLGEEAFGGYFKFAFVRNPFDRFVSYCAFMLRGGEAFQQRPQEVMRHFLFEAPPDHHILFQPQARLLVDEDGKTLLADEVGRVEDMQGSFDAICARIGIPSRRLDRVNGTRRGDYRSYYDQALIDAVAARYAQDLELFGYSFEGAR